MVVLRDGLITSVFGSVAQRSRTLDSPLDTVPQAASEFVKGRAACLGSSRRFVKRLGCSSGQLRDSCDYE